MLSNNMNASPLLDLRLLGPNPYKLPNLNCDGCNKKLPYGETICWSDASKDKDFCEECIHHGQDDDPELNLIKTTVMERIAPIADKMLSEILISNFQKSPSSTYELWDKDGESCGIVETVGTPSCEFINRVMKNSNATRMERSETNVV